MTTQRRNIVLGAEAGLVNVSPLGFHRYASQFLRTARLVRSHARRNFSPVPYYPQDEIRKANACCVAKGFEYFEVRRAVRGYADLPNLDQLDAACTRLADSLEAACRNA